MQDNNEGEIVLYQKARNEKNTTMKIFYSKDFIQM